MHDQPAPAHDGLSDDEKQQNQKLHRQLEIAVGRLFYESCDGVTQSLLMKCSWRLTTRAVTLTLELDCPTDSLYGRMKNHMASIGDRLLQLASHARVRICPPPEGGEWMEVEVDEFSDYGMFADPDGSSRSPN
jgi:hypothetical protein